MKSYIRMVVSVLGCLLAIGGVLYWAVNTVQSRTISGSHLSFNVDTGGVALVNNTAEPIAINVTSIRSFNIVNADRSITLASHRSEDGQYVAEGVLLAGNVELQTMRGMDMNFELAAQGVITATITPKSASETGTTLLIALSASVALLFFASYSTGHAWLVLLRRRPVSTQSPDTSEKATVMS